MFERFDADTRGIATTLCYHSFQCPCISKWTHLSCQSILVQPNLLNTSPMQRYHVYPKNLIHLACDAFGVFPAVSKLKLSQTMYHFISGYTALVNSIIPILLVKSVNNWRLVRLYGKEQRLSHYIDY